MKTVCRFISFVLILLVAVIVIFNVSNTITLETSFLSLKANVGFLIFFCAVIGGLSTILFLMSLNKSDKVENSKFKRQFENTKLNYEIESEKVKQLEAKIKTLEEALKIATKNSC